MRFKNVLILVSALFFSPPLLVWSTPSGGEFQAFFDEAVPKLMEEHHVAGAVVGITDGSETLFQKGYGTADLSADLKVDAERTLFRPGSISKLFTWTAIMQLEERGLLELTDPVEKYLDFRLPATYPQPIRIIDLMNHTPGFADRLIGLFVIDDEHRQSLRQSVSKNIPRRVRPPGKVSSYSNYGTMLAGYIVQRISGIPYEEYVKQYIFQPLGMEHSTMVQPPERTGMSRGYSFSGGTFQEAPFEIVNGAPAGALSSTCADMLRFFRAYINDGGRENERILRTDTVRAIRKTSFRHDPRANGMAHGFIEMGMGPYTVLGHGGDTIYFHSASGYLPEEDWAFFISTNTSTGGVLTAELQQLMFSEFYPLPAGEELAEKANMKPDLKEYTGFFSMDRRPESDPTKIIGLFSQLKPEVAADGKGLFIQSILDPEGSVYLPVAKDIFQQKKGQRRVIYLRDSRGRVESVYSNEVPVFLFSRPPWFEGLYLNMAVFGLGALLLISATLVPPVGLLSLIPAIRRKRHGRTLWYLRFSIWGYIGLFAIQVLIILSMQNLIFVPLGPVHLIPLYLAGLALLPMIATLVLLWKKGELRPVGRIYLTLFTAAQVLLFAQLGYWGFFFI